MDLLLRERCFFSPCCFLYFNCLCLLGGRLGTPHEFLRRIAGKTNGEDTAMMIPFMSPTAPCPRMSWRRLAAGSRCSKDHVRAAYRTAWEECRMNGDRCPR